MSVTREPDQDPGAVRDAETIAAVRPAACTRRRLLQGALLALLPWGLLGGRRAGAAQANAYPETIAALEHALLRETMAHERYVKFAARAQADRFGGVAYLFTAFADSENVHARNFQRILANLGSKFQATAPLIPVAGTKENLITAANDEIDTIDHLYPETLRRLKPENQPEAVEFVTYALASEKQHRELIEKVQRYSEGFFDRVVKAIDEITSHYFVCQICGSTLKKIPAGTCPICGQPARNYLRIEPLA